ncbi:MAG: hypothetical protein COV32_00815 [Candidatus Yonathbacteria bacterium CG10_big_fil_rev_8_21_14_0_10_43_136]|uniref:Uncharacterized protein n=1 Tax=Candidatus Nomurabacteria bacterium CG2_30_43_9 TaxID=1805283 RepID=A0A1J5GGS3_9BACT|nr:MAG: hypothetical protein AUK15_00650 [Candidatus Nomurabacteria bacterium CG2_30_43_9]PIR40829.1 MAG: hypothetical protein COV32_00815 [Candidatus Yonathbacteria bacterium CG10_big_fil_rev_8_21_14_0_10_43_136]PIX57201.1 MAG: hypothetical protein COZ48_01945 [Candidatus Yonathbacteria bacterium CG_4_10_14_3_um_filter_43_12]PJC22129.1 MAG: hypothetical protein CO060_01580 [Candidatus Yonathbacteria bacterium CG_4_9_14_0_2_um_filter_43_16]
MNIEVTIFYLVLLDAIVCNLLSLFCADWYVRNFRVFSHWFPIGEGWAIYYLVLVLWVWSLMYRNGMLF